MKERKATRICFSRQNRGNLTNNGSSSMLLIFGLHLYFSRVGRNDQKARRGKNRNHCVILNRREERKKEWLAETKSSADSIDRKKTTGNNLFVILIRWLFSPLLFLGPRNNEGEVTFFWDLGPLFSLSARTNEPTRIPRERRILPCLLLILFRCCCCCCGPRRSFPYRAQESLGKKRTNDNEEGTL